MSGARYTSPEELQGWFAGRLPTDWFVGPSEVTADREEILVVGTLADPGRKEGPAPGAGAARTLASGGWGSRRRPNTVSDAGFPGASGAATCSSRSPP